MTCRAPCVIHSDRITSCYRDPCEPRCGFHSGSQMAQFTRQRKSKFRTSSTGMTVGGSSCPKAAILDIRKMGRHPGSRLSLCFRRFRFPVHKSSSVDGRNGATVVLVDRWSKTDRCGGQKLRFSAGKVRKVCERSERPNGAGCDYSAYLR